MNNKGFASIALVVAAFAVVAIAGVFYLTLNKSGISNPSQDSVMENEIVASPAPISDSDDIETIEAELDATVVGNIQTDFDDLDTSAESL